MYLFKFVKSREKAARMRGFRLGSRELKGWRGGLRREWGKKKKRKKETLGELGGDKKE